MSLHYFLLVCIVSTTYATAFSLMIRFSTRTTTANETIYLRTVPYRLQVKKLTIRFLLALLSECLFDPFTRLSRPSSSILLHSVFSHYQQKHMFRTYYLVYKYINSQSYRCILLPFCLYFIHYLCHCFSLTIRFSTIIQQLQMKLFTYVQYHIVKK